ncbi:MAG: aldo/keto reductase [Planctomycetes bacterium]|nr:aldo/keto reductase [Planctomycetota bacterium]MBI3848017.1 aldo/keto reductase [Planctomycetota bacterium]
MALSGFATTDGTGRIRARAQSSGGVAEDHFRECDGLWLSSIGIGTYLGEGTDAADRAYREAIEAFVERGGNVIDTAINYRFQRSERQVGEAIAELVRTGRASRDEIVVATKGGFVPYDGAAPARPSDWFAKVYLDTGIVDPDELAAGCHCMSPRYLSDQIERSRQNLGLETIDVYYVHNPEMQLEEVGRSRFRGRLHDAFCELERAVSAGKIRAYGTATWEGYRCVEGATSHLDLEEVVAIAREAGGPNHHFRFVQLPVSLAFPEAFLVETQATSGGATTFVDVAARLGVTVMASAPMLQGRLAGRLSPRVAEVLPGFDTNAQRAIQFTRSVPGLAVALVGMGHLSHVVENLVVARTARAPEASLRKLYAG